MYLLGIYLWKHCRGSWRLAGASRAAVPGRAFVQLTPLLPPRARRQLRPVGLSIIS